MRKDWIRLSLTRTAALVLTLLTCTGVRAQLWFDHPATAWEEALPLGNGQLGAMVWGGVDEELIQLNEATLWSGRPVPASVNPEARKYLPQVREALARKDYALADQLCRRMQGHYSQSYLPLGDLRIRYRYRQPSPNQSSHNGYERKLDLRTGMLNQDYWHDGAQYGRRMFVSHSDSVLVVQLYGSGMGLDISLASQLRPTFARRGDSILVMHGQAPRRVDPNYYNKKGREPIEWNEGDDAGMRWQVSLGVHTNQDARLWSDADGLHVEGAEYVEIFLTAATSFNGPYRDPNREGRDEAAQCDRLLTKAMNQSWAELQQRHEQDFASYFDRVQLTLWQPKNSLDTIPTDRRLRRYSEGAADTGLEKLLFDYGRYLLIASSAPDGVPANLQGIWNPHLRAPWSSNYTININTEMNYWLAEPCNLSELHQPLLRWIQSLERSGRRTAREFYGMDGWVAHHNSDIWGMTCPVGNLGDGDPQWANWYMGAAWLCQHLWEHYAFTLDKKYLKEVYPTMREAAQFCMEWLVEKQDADGQTYLITAPSTSPENRFRYGDKTYAVSEGTTMDVAIIRDLFGNVIKASKVLGKDSAFRRKVEQKRMLLMPLRISSRTGRLMEWLEDFDDEDPHHRHISHLFALHPGNQISPITNPVLAKAAQRTFDLRGDAGTGWSMAWKMNFAARLLDGNHAYKMLRQALQYVDPQHPRHGGTFPNLFDAHPPFQIDGNFGVTAGVCEMLLQSHLDEIHLLPALPDAWHRGSVKGLKARGGFTVGMTWAERQLTEATVTSDAGQPCRLRTWQPVGIDGAPTTWKCDTLSDGRKCYVIEFPTVKGQTYTIKPLPTPVMYSKQPLQLVWHDEFDGTGPLDTAHWEAEHGFVRNEEYQWYQTENAYRREGVLVLEARLDSIPNPRFRGEDATASPTLRGRGWQTRRPYARYSSASVNTRGHFSFRYGRMEVRARIPAVRGAWPAIWTLGTEMPWPSNGECDVMEFYQVDGKPTILANAAWGNDRPYSAVWNSQRIPYQHFLDKDPAWGEKFHVWTMDWTEDFIRIYLDGELLNDIPLAGTVNGSVGNHKNPFHQPHYILLDLAIGGQNGGEPDDADFPMLYEIDYVRVWQTAN